VIKNKIQIIASDNKYIMRTWSAEDALFLYELNNDHDVIKYTGDVAFESLEKAKKFVENYRQFEESGCGRWLIEEKVSKIVVGWCGIKYHHDTKEYDLGYRLMKQYWNQGIATRASLMAIDYAIYALRLKKLYATVINENIASIKIIEKLGFTFTQMEMKENEAWYRYDRQIINQINSH
jgi:RimJ/RimL family protein N-acetyltransferase